VGSRSLEKAKAFIKDNCPEGGAAQKEGLSGIETVPKASYSECVNDEVSPSSINFTGTVHGARTRSNSRLTLPIPFPSFFHLSFFFFTFFFIHILLNASRLIHSRMSMPYI
jgi:hypothetical protein